MARLTEEMVIARSKQSDLAAIKKLNCWGSELSDVSIIRRMRGVEVLAFSVNKINTLSPFENCVNLQELYLRKNNINDINELVYLQNLPKLKYLWLEENPCVDTAGPNYRAIVLRALPNLKKLDNVDVTPEEVTDAMSMRSFVDDPQPQPTQQQQYRNSSPINDQSQSTTSPSSQLLQQQMSPENESECNSDPIDRSSPASSPLQRSPMNRDNSYSPPPVANNNQSSQRANFQQYDRSPGSDQDSPVTGYRERIPPSMSTHSMKEYYQSDYQQRQPPGNYRHSQVDLTEWDESSQNPVNNNNVQSNYNSQYNQPANNRRSVVSNDRDGYQYRNGNGKIDNREDWEDVDRRSVSNNRRDSRYNDNSSVISNAVLNHLAGVHRRPVNRNSNLLSATLCLVKELDYPSLEVVEHAVRCRIDELAE